VEKMSKLSKKKVDVSFIDPMTMQVVCTFNQCYKKFTIEGTEVVTFDSGEEYVQGFHECTECGRRVKGKGDGSRGYKEQQARKGAKQSNDHDEAMREEFGK
jgi:hypothetical protein